MSPTYNAGTYNQIALRGANAMTIFKSQGQTFTDVYADFEKWVFATGLVYVGLSRLTSLEGLGLRRPIKSKDITVNKESLEFLEKIGA